MKSALLSFGVKARIIVTGFLRQNWPLVLVILLALLGMEGTDVKTKYEIVIGSCLAVLILKISRIVHWYWIYFLPFLSFYIFMFCNAAIGSYNPEIKNYIEPLVSCLERCHISRLDQLFLFCTIISVCISFFIPKKQSKIKICIVVFIITFIFTKIFWLLYGLIILAFLWPWPL